MSTTSPIRLDPAHLGMVRAATDIAPGALEECNRLLHENHETYHMFFRDTAGHNHIVHSLLTVLALGASPQELRDRYDDSTPIQRPIPEIDHDLVGRLYDPGVFAETIGEITQYHTFLEFFKRKIDAEGYQAVVNEYVFSRTSIADNMLARMYEGAYHPIIHLGLGVEFDQPAIVAEALAQAAAHDDSHIGKLFLSAEAEASSLYPQRGRPTSMLSLLHQVRATDAIRKAPEWTDFGAKMRNGVVGRALEPMSSLAAQFRIRAGDEEDLHRRTAEMANVCAFFAGAAQREGRPRKIDFFYMHSVTSSIFFTVLARQQWIRLEDRIRLVEWKARLDLAWYAVSGCAALDADAVSSYSSPESDGMGWEELFAAVNREHDDGHAAKFIRALKSAGICTAEYEQDWDGTYFPMRGDMFLKLARMCQDTTKNMDVDLKWVFFTGFEQPWGRPDLQPKK